MADIIRMPKMSDTMEAGVIAAWLKKVGDTVQAGDVLAEVETDKATMELEAYEDGTLLHIGVGEKETVAINGVIAILGEPDEDIAALLADIQAEGTATVEAATPTHHQETTASNRSTNTNHQEITASSPGASTHHQETTASNPGAQSVQPIGPTVSPQTNEPNAHTHHGRLLVSPLAKKIAQDQGHDLNQIQGTGDGGRIIKRDIANLAQVKPILGKIVDHSMGMVSQESYTDTPISSMRKTIAKRLSESKLAAPEFYLTVSIDMDQLVAARPKINAYASVKITFNDLVIKAAAMALKQHPTINAAWLADKIRYYQHIHIGVAMAVADGLLVPVVRFADQQNLTQLANQVQTLSQKAHSNQLKPKDWEGSTFTLSNLGMLGIESFTAIINPPAACILAVGAIQQIPVVKQGTIVPGHVMKATLTCDHRVVDGAAGAVFLKTFKDLLEDPLRLLV